MPAEAGPSEPLFTEVCLREWPVCRGSWEVGIPVVQARASRVQPLSTCGECGKQWSGLRVGMVGAAPCLQPLSSGEECLKPWPGCRVVC